jgi:isocitrate lyase
VRRPRACGWWSTSTLRACFDRHDAGEGGGKIADIVFATIKDRRGRSILSVRDQNNYKPEARRQRLMTLLHLFLVHRYKAFSVHYVSPTDDNQLQAQEMKSFGFYDEVNSEIGHIIVARVNVAKISQWTGKDQMALKDLIFHSAEGEQAENVVT